jgi:hypothetical protein
LCAGDWLGELLDAKFAVASLAHIAAGGVACVLVSLSLQAASCVPAGTLIGTQLLGLQQTYDAAQPQPYRPLCYRSAHKPYHR